MTKKLTLFLAFLYSVLLVSETLAAVNLPELVKKVRPAIVTVITYDGNNQISGIGTGFFINNKGHMITNYHVFKGAYSAEVRTYEDERYPIKLVIAENKTSDLVKVLVNIPEGAVKWVTVTEALPNIAERVLVVGSPLGLEQTVTEGIVSSIRKMPGVGKILQISAPISPGSSGSPVINMEGVVVGVVTFYLLEGQNLNFAIPGERVIDLKQRQITKTFSQWAYGARTEQLEEKKRQKGHLFVYTRPSNAIVRILNIKPKFYQGIGLGPGKYLVEVSAKGYETRKEWAKVDTGGDKKLNIILKRSAHALKDQKDVNVPGMQFVLIRSGSFWMGGMICSTKSRFYIQTTEVTQGQWKTIMGNNPSYFNDCGDDCPVEQVTWSEIQEFIRRLNQREGRNKYRYRLPTRAEWGLAARDVKSETVGYCEDESSFGEYAWFRNNSENRTRPVGKKKSNSRGLYDMHGNVEELCRVVSKNISSSSLNNPTARPSTLKWDKRGGNWNSHFKPRLFVKTEPENAIVRFLNRRPRSYQWGMDLKPGRYNLEVSTDCYWKKKLCLDLATGESRHIIVTLLPDLNSYCNGKLKPQMWDDIKCMGAANKFHAVMREKISDEYLSLRGQDAVGATKEAQIWVNEKFEEIERGLSNEYQRRCFRGSEYTKSTISFWLGKLRRHELAATPDDAEELDSWASNTLGFRLVKEFKPFGNQSLIK